MWICLEKAFYCIIQNCPIGLVFMIIAYEYVTFLILCLIPWFSSNPISTSFVAIEFHLFLILLIISYWKSCFNSPGTIPENINDYFPQVQEIKEKCIQIKKNNEFQRRKAHPKYKDNENTLINEEKPETYQAINMDICKTKELPIISEIHLEINDISYCFKCDKIKMPRAHHCRICNKCILRMDHHCPWTGNCVGLKNHKYFVLFLSYACISLLNIFLCMANTSYATLFGHMRDEEFSKIINTLLCFVIAFTFFIAIFGLLCYNIYSLSKNVTTIELNIPEIEKRNPFKKESALENIQEVLGEDMWFWWLPTTPKFKEEYHQLDISFAQAHKL